MFKQKEVIEISDKVLEALTKTSEEELYTWDELLEGEGLGNKKNNDHLTMELWEWPQGVALYGIYKLYKETNNEKYLDYLTEWFDKKIKEGLPSKNINTVAPLLTLIHIYEIRPNEKYLEICNEWAEWIMEELPRTEEGGFQHVTTHTINEQEIWDDTLFMTVLFISKMSEITKKEKYKQEAIKQFLVHIKYLADSKTGLWYHGWCFDGRHNFGEVFWARGNSWFTAGAVEFVEILDMPESVKEYVLDAFRAQAKTLLEVQSKQGLWHTVLDDETSYIEASGSAAITYGLLKGIREGYIDKKYEGQVLNAVESLLKCIDEEGIVEQVSYGTAMGMDVEHYKTIEVCPTAYGQALVVLMLAELHRYL